MILCVTINPCIDRTIWVNQLHGEGILRGVRTKVIAGGKGNNVARVLKALGHETLSLNLLGGATGRLVADLITKEDRLPLCAVWTAAPTREVLTVVEKGTFRQVAYVEPGPQISDVERRALMDEFASLARKADWIILSGSAPCASMQAAFAEMTRVSRSLGRRVVVDTRGPALRLAVRERPFLVKPNAEEIRELFGQDVSCEEAVDRLKSLGIEVAVVTRGERGALAYWDKRYELQPPAVQEVNPVGSGDAMVAAMVAGLLEDRSPEEILRRGIAAAAANVRVWDAAFVSLEDIEELSPHVEVLVKDQEQNARGR